MNRNFLLHIALAVALLFHASGIIGILFTPYKDWFVQNTFLNLVLMAALIILTHPARDKKFLIFLGVVFTVGFTAEVVGTNTGLIFGSYRYGTVMGVKLFDVPLIMGINWFIIIYCAGMITQAYENYMLRKINEKGITVSKQMMLAAFIIDAAFLVFLFDWLMEPVAVKLGYWQWEKSRVPLFNYICWIIISTVLLAVFKKLNRDRHNIFAVHLFIIQVLFFLVLRTFL